MYVRLYAEKEEKMTETLYWVWLTTTMKFAHASLNKVLFKFTPEEAYNASRESLEAAGLDSRTVEKLCDKSLDRAESIIAKCRRRDISVICSTSRDYPRALDRLDDKPHVIYVRGDIGCLRGKRTACFIGTRRMTRRGEELGIEHARRLIADGNLLVSGVADGIDTVAASVSLDMGVPTVAVLGVDIDRYYPVSNGRLIDKIAETGAVISEYPPDTNARFFATRNRIIVGLSDTVNVIEAPSGSGALIGAELALKKKIPTYAANLSGETFEGCRMLISKGAIPLNSDADVPKIEIKPSKKAEKTVKPSAKREIPAELQGTCRHIYEILLKGPAGEDAFITETHDVTRVLCALTELELMGYIRSLPGSRYQLK